MFQLIIEETIRANTFYLLTINSFDENSTCIQSNYLKKQVVFFLKIYIYKKK